MSTRRARPPASPKLNGAVDRAERTYAQDFYEVRGLPWTLLELDEPLCPLCHGEDTSHPLRPYASLRSPPHAQALAQLQATAPLSHMS